MVTGDNLPTFGDKKSHVLASVNSALNSLKDSLGSPVIKAIEKVCKAGQESGKTIGMFVPDDTEAKKWMAQGATLFLLSSDHSFIINGANRLIATLKS